MSLKILELDFTHVSDLTPLKGMPLQRLEFVGCRARDFSVLSTLEAVDGTISPWVPWLTGKIKKEEMLRRDRNGYAPIYIGMKLEAEGKWQEAEKHWAEARKSAAEKTRGWIRGHLDWIRKRNSADR
jgi:hypothetical protein